MFRFANIELLWLLVSVPVFIAAFILIQHRKRRQLEDFGDAELVKDLMPNASRIRPVVKFGMTMVALVLLILAAARPQFGQTEKTVKRQGMEVMMALDISNSMLAEDVAPNRLDRAKQMLSRMIDKMTEDKVGMVVFAGEAFTQLPITCDYVSAKMFLNTITPDLIKTQGTAIGAAINTCIRCFGSEESEIGRAIILITDGENHEDDAVAAAQAAADRGMHVYVVGIGKPEGSPIPLPGTGSFRKDREGNVVVSRLDESMCQEIAKAGRGVYVHCDNTNTAMRALENELDKLATEEIESTIYTDYNEQYQSFVLIALLLLVIEFFIFGRKNKTLQRFDIFRERTMNKKMMLALVLILSLPAMAQKESPDVRHGNRDYKHEQYDKAELDYRRGLDKNENSVEAHYNLGNALFRQNKYPEAGEQYALAAKQLDPKKDKTKLSHAFHNLGNAFYGQQQYDKAVASYQNALRLNPKDDETRYNLVKAMQMLQQQQQNQDQNQQNQQQQQQEQQQQNQDQQQEQQQQQQQEQQQEQQQDPNQMDKETAEQILQALEQDEQETQDKLQRQQGERRRVEKEW